MSPMTMRRALSISACLAGLAVAMGSTRDASADHISQLSLASTRSLTVNSSVGMLALVDHDPTLRARHVYELLAALPVTQSADRTYDVRPIVNVVFGQTFQLTDTIVIKFVRGRNIVQANLGPGRTLGVMTNGFGAAQGGVLAFSSYF